MATVAVQIGCRLIHAKEERLSKIRSNSHPETIGASLAWWGDRR
jgi:hypothetical protein